MFPFKIRMDLQTLLFVFLLSGVCGQDREIFPQLNPGCESCTTNNTLMYIQANGTHDTIHQIWDFTRGMPTIIYAITKPTTHMIIRWEGTEPDITLSEDPIYSFAMIMDQVYEYEDRLDLGHIDDKDPTRPLSLRRVTWTRQDSAASDREAMLRLRGYYRDRRVSGVIDMKLDLVPFKDYSVDLPHLIHTVNSTTVDVSLVNFTSTLNASRLAAHVVLASTDAAADTMRYNMRKSLDDEHAPGVFEIVDILTPRSSDAGAAGGFLQLRPVAYTEAARSLSSSTDAYISPFNRTSLPARSTLSEFAARAWRAPVLSQDMFVSFGLPGDGYYRQHNYTSWSFTFGYGSPPAESVSLFVVVVVALGLGVPLLLALSGALCVLLRRRRDARARPERFTDDE